MSKPTLHLIMGLPGAGKTTLSKLLQDITHGTRISSDDYRLLLFAKPKFTQKEHDNLYAMIDHNVEHLLQAGHDVIYDANLNRRTHRQEKYDLAQRHDANVKLWWVKTDSDVAKKRRITQPDSRLIPAGEDPASMFDRVADLIEEPTSDEQYTEIEGVGLTEDVIRALL